MSRRAILLPTLLVAAGGVLWGLARNPRSPPKDVPSASQESADDEISSIDSLIAAGEPLYWDGDFEGARRFWQAALQRAGTQDETARAKALTWLGLAAYRLGEYEESRTLGQTALDLKLRLGLTAELAKSYNALGLLALVQGRLAEAAELFQKTTEAARAAGDEETLAKAANNLGLVYSDLGEFTRAREGFLRSVAAARELEDPLIEGRALSNLGMLEERVGSPLEAVTWFQEARRRYRASGDVAGEQHTLGQLGVTYAALGEPRRAIAALDSALALARAHGLRLEEASDLELIGRFHRDAGDHRRALEFYEKAGEINAELGLAIEAGVDLRRQAEAYLALGDADQARALTEEALATHRAAEAHFEILNDLLVLADLAGSPSAQSRQLNEARVLVERLDSRAARVNLALTEARIAERAGDSRRSLAVLDAAGGEFSRGDYRTLSRVEALRARAHARVGELDPAAAAGRRAVTAIERVRSSYGSGYLRTTLVADQRAIYSDLVEILVRSGKVEEAFEIADAARGRTLLEHLTAAPSAPAGHKSSAGLHEEGERLLREIDGLAALLADLESTPLEDRASDHEATIERVVSQLQSTRADYESLAVRLDERDPAAAILGRRHINALEVRSALSSDEALLEYLVTPDRLWIFVVTRDRVAAIERTVPAATLIRQVRLARDLSASPSPGRPDPASVLESLHRELLEPPLGSGMLRRAKRLILVPHDMLVYLPFAALRDAKGRRFLIEDYLLTTLPSAAALPVLRRGFSDFDSGTRHIVLAPFPERLPGTEVEAASVTRALARARRLDGSRATEDVARRALGSDGIVHVATHGVLNVQNPLFSRIELAPGGNEGPDDGRLEVHEILGLSIQSPLVFLSGCETAAGEAWTNAFARGEDYATLAQALLYAGARTVIATLWRIEDRGAAVFAARFYGHLKTRPPVEALALAQRDMIRSRRYGAPYYWAAYRLSGAGAMTGSPARSARLLEPKPQKRSRVAFHDTIGRVRGALDSQPARRLRNFLSLWRAS